MYKQLKENWKKNGLSREKLLKWRKESAFKRIENPTRLAKARELGYKAKKGFILVRARVKKGGRKRPKPTGGRKPKKAGRVKFTPEKSLKEIAEERTQKKYPNLEVLNSYYVGGDGKHKWFEIILVDPSHSSIKNDPDIQL